MSNQATKAARSLTSTLLLPKTSFPPRARHDDTAIYIKRCSDDLYAWQRRERPAEKTFILHDGPPYANGDLHVGHALNKILKDIICRFRLAQGHRVDFVPGWDCHGLPIELKALQQHKVLAKDGVSDPGPVEIRSIARQLAEKTVKAQMSQFRSWGIMADWDNAWKTMDREFELRQLFVFLALFSEGLILRKHKPVYWSPSSRTALAEAELEYNDEHESTAALVAFKLDLPPEIMAGQYAGLKALIWTTTPWTLPANQAIAINTNFLYTIVDSKKFGHLLVAKSRLEFVRKQVEDDISVIQDDIPGSFFTDSKFSYKSPFDHTDVDRFIYGGQFVTDATGTGLVHAAPGHGMEDWDSLREHIRRDKAKLKAPVDDAGCFTNDAMPDNPTYLAGTEVLGEGQRRVLGFLSEKNMLLSAYPFKHKYPYDWRSKQPVIIRATPQWFAAIQGIKQRAVKSLGKVDFFPKSGKSRLQSFVENRPEWCISRQRAWGVPIPAIYDRRSGEAIMTDQTIAHIMQVIRDRGTDAWWSDPADDEAWLHPSLLYSSAAKDYRRGMDTMDVWFDSGTSWAQLMNRPGQQRETLADLYIEGTDQHRGWFQSSLLTRIAYQASIRKDLESRAPYGALITHGFTLDAKGKKMSKSLGNVISPLEIITGTFNQAAGARPPALGPDTLRLWVASSDFTTDVVVSHQALSNVQSLLHKLRTSFKVLLGMLSDFDPKVEIASVGGSQFGHVDSFALWRLSLVTEDIFNNFGKYEFYKGITRLMRYINTDLSASYIESVRDRIYCEDANAPTRRAAQSVLLEVTQRLSAILAPVCPILIEETWRHMPVRIRETTTHPLEADFATLGRLDTDGYVNAFYDRQWPVLMAVNTVIKSLQEKARMDGKMSSSLQSTVRVVFDDPKMARTSHQPRPIARDSSPFELLTTYTAPLASKQELPELYVISDFQVGVNTSTMASKDFANLDSKSRQWIYEEDVEFPNGDKATVQLFEPKGDKCDRCWRWVVDTHLEPGTGGRKAISDEILEGVSFEKEVKPKRQSRKSRPVMLGSSDRPVADALATSEDTTLKDSAASSNQPSAPLAIAVNPSKPSPTLCNRCITVLEKLVAPVDGSTDGRQDPVPLHEESESARAVHDAAAS